MSCCQLKVLRELLPAEAPLIAVVSSVTSQEPGILLDQLRSLTKLAVPDKGGPPLLSKAATEHFSDVFKAGPFDCYSGLSLGLGHGQTTDRVTGNPELRHFFTGE